MSGITGLVYLDGRDVRPDDVQQMHQAIEHRGPDRAGQWVEGCTGLAHRALNTTPEATHERQPLHCTESGVVLAADARIDNREELIQLLDPRPTHRPVVTDADLILAAYKKWGTECPLQLVGAFAFALWDKREQRLLLACDHMALRTLFYYRDRDFVAFGTEIKSLFHIEGVPRETNEAVIADHLTTVARRELGATFYTGIYQLPAAHRLVISKDTFNSDQYWDLNTDYELKLSGEEEYVEAFRDEFRQAVSCRLRAVGPAGSTLSGGLDSSSIACMARDVLRDNDTPIHTFSCIFPGLDNKELELIDERSYMKAVTSTKDVEGHYVRADQHSPMVEIDRFLRHTDDGFWGGNMYLHWLMFRRAHDQGIRVFFDGSDGDSTVSHGRAYLRELIRTCAWNEFEHEIRAAADLKSDAPDQLARHFAYPELADHAKNRRAQNFLRTVQELHSRFGLPYREMMMGPGLRSLLPETWSDRLDAWRGRSNKEGSGRGSLINQDFAVSQCIEHRFNSAYLAPDQKEEVGQNHRVSHAQGLTDPQFMYGLNLADKAAAAHEVEPRYPFFDRRLMEFCVSLPGFMKRKDGWDRYVLRRAMKDILPPKIQWRIDKSRLGANLSRNFWRHENDQVQEMLSSGRFLLSPYVDITKLESLVEECRAEKDNRARLSTSSEVMGSFMLWRWLEKERVQRRDLH